MYRVDERDLHIVAAKERNPFTSAQTIATELGLSKPAVFFRLRRLEDRGILSYRTVVDRDKLSAAQAA